MQRLLAIGDCNTLGAGTMKNAAYPERVSHALGINVTNKGHTMATTREGELILRDNVEGSDFVFIQFGLVDSYLTFKYSPYVYYYPDNFLKKQFRSVTKKYKKICRKSGLNRILGQANVVPVSEYEKRIRSMVHIASPRPVFLIDTLPHHESERNQAIQQYNSVLDAISEEFGNCHRIILYNEFEKNMDHWYQDKTHCNEQGYKEITKIILDQWVDAV